MLVFFSYPCWWIGKKSEVVINGDSYQESWEIVLRKFIKEIVIKKKNEVVMFENEVVIFEIVFGMVQRQPYKEFYNP